MAAARTGDFKSEHFQREPLVEMAINVTGNDLQHAALLTDNGTGSCGLCQRAKTIVTASWLMAIIFP